MALLQPLALIFLGTLPLIVLLYMLRIRRQDVTFSSVMLWQEFKQEMSERITWHPPIRNMLLLLQLLIALLLALALARPSVLGAMRAQKNTIVLVDASASMQAVDVRPSRFAEARRQALALVNALNADDTTTVIRVGERPTIVQTGSDRALLAAAINDMVPGSGGADMKTALALAKSLSRPGAVNGIEILSDGGFTGAESVTDIPASVHLSLIGNDGNNQAVASVSARPLVAGGNRCEGFARIVNYADRDVKLPVVASVDGSPIDQRVLELKARESKDLWYDMQAGGRLIEVRITANDALPIDDAGQALCPRPRQIDALLVSDTPNALQTALGLLPNVKLTTINSGQYTPGRQADLYIFETNVPEKLPQNAGNILVVGPRNGGPIVEVQGTSTGVSVVKSDAASPLLASLDPSAITLNRVARFDTPEWGRAAVETEEGPLVVAGEREGRRVVILAFELSDNTALPSKLAFPLLLANSVNWLTPGSVPEAVAPGQAVVIQPATAVAEVVVERPNGESVTLKTRGEPVTFTRTGQLGKYRVVQRNGGWVASDDNFIVGPIPEAESRIRPQGEIVFNTVDPGATGLRASLGQEVWPLLALLGLGLLGLEWWWYHFRR